MFDFLKKIQPYQFDIIIGTIFMLLLTFVFMYFDFFEFLVEFTRLHEEWNLDELILVFLAMGFVALLYSRRRIVEIKKLKEELEQLNHQLNQRLIKEEDKNYSHELKILEQSKLASLGEMIGNISHQWRQPLSVISTVASGILLKKHHNILKDEELEEYTNHIIKHTEYLSETINTFRNFIEEDRSLKKTILQERLDKVLEIVSMTLKNNNIELINNIDYNEKIEIEMVIGELEQVIISILNNSKDAILDNNITNGWIQIRTLKQKDKIVIFIEDNGGGISEKILPNIFEPYFTTKHKSQGTGLGLYMSYKVITQNLKGDILIENSKNGVICTIEIPLNHLL